VPFDFERYHQLRTSTEVGAHAFYVEQSATTMEDARRGLDSGEACGSAYVAGYMTAGRGRSGRRWTYTAGRGLHVTYSICLDEFGAGAVSNAPLLTVAAALATAEAIEATSGLRPQIKWPNDLLADDRKIVGILVESRVQEARFEAFVGIGVNILEPDEWPPEFADRATSLEAAGYATPDRETLLAALSSAFEPQIKRLATDRPALVEEWTDRLVTIGQRIRFDAPGGALEGVAEGVAPSGELLLRLDDGRLQLLAAGDVTTLR
jgi:BirA family biotin operon repressor/biotin-[acetyl-CoA-carboxylase] ligase